MPDKWLEFGSRFCLVIFLPQGDLTVPTLAGSLKLNHVMEESINISSKTEP